MEEQNRGNVQVSFILRPTKTFILQSFTPSWNCADYYLLCLFISLNLLLLCRESVWVKGHAPTNFEKWKNARENYKVIFFL